MVMMRSSMQDIAGSGTTKHIDTAFNHAATITGRTMVTMVTMATEGFRIVCI